MTVSIVDWALVGATVVAESAFYATMFVPAYATAAAIIAIRRRQLNRMQPSRRESDDPPRALEDAPGGGDWTAAEPGVSLPPLRAVRTDPQRMEPR